MPVPLLASRRYCSSTKLPAPYELKPEDPKSASYAIRIQGDSMEPAFHDGGIAFVNHDALDNGDIGVFCVDGGTVIKQYYHDPLGMTSGNRYVSNPASGLASIRSR